MSKIIDVIVAALNEVATQRGFKPIPPHEIGHFAAAAVEAIGVPERDLELLASGVYHTCDGYCHEQA